MIHTCRICGYTWQGRKPTLDRPKPVQCPNCHSHKWDTKGETA